MENGTGPGMEQGFSERLKRYRKERNLTQQQLADALGVSNKSVSRWESGGGSRTCRCWCRGQRRWGSRRTICWMRKSRCGR